MWKIDENCGNHMVSTDYQWYLSSMGVMVEPSASPMASRRPQHEGSGARRRWWPWTLTLYGECGFMNLKTSKAGCFTWKLLGRVVLSLAIGLFNGVIMWLVNGLIWSKDVYCIWVVAWRSLFVCVWFVFCSFVGYSSWAFWQTPRRWNQDLLLFLFGGYSFHAENWNSREMNMQIQQKLWCFSGRSWGRISLGSQGGRVLPLMVRLDDADASSRPIPTLE